MNRRAFVFFSLIALGTLLSPLSAQVLMPSSAGCGDSVNNKPLVEWAQFHFDSCHTGYNPFERILSPANVGNLVVNWTSRQLSDEIVAAPAVADGVLYEGSAGAYPGVYAIDTKTGHLLWSAQDFLDHAGSPAIAYGRVYVASIRDVRALDPTTGQTLWQTQDPFGDFPVPEITVANGSVYVASYHVGMYQAQHLYALDANTGAVLWMLSGEDWGATTPAVSNGTVYLGCDSPNLCAYDSSTGALLWKYAASGNISPVAVSNGVVYFGSVSFLGYDDTLTYAYALNATTGELLWQRPVGTLSSANNETLTTPAVANGVMYIGSASNNYPQRGELYAVNTSTGQLMWSYRAAGVIDSSPAVANGVVYFGSADEINILGNFYALDANTGALLWKYAADYIVVSAPAVANGTLYAGSLESMYAFHLPN